MDMNDSDSGIINDLHLAEIDIDTAEEYILHVKQVLNDVLPEKRLTLVGEDKIRTLVYSLYKDEDVSNYVDSSYNYLYYPIIIVDMAVKKIVAGFKSQKTVTSEANLDSSNELEDDSGDDENYVRKIMPSILCNRETLVPLCKLYPDIDPAYLRQIIERFDSDPEKIQQFLESNLDIIPERRTIQAVQYRLLSSSCNLPREKPWQCPQCRSWQIISTIDAKLTDVDCKELVSCGSFCVLCNKSSHHPFKCRKTNERMLRTENEIDIFKKLTVPATEVRPTYKTFVMNPRNEANYADPLDILYTTAEGTFLRMLKKSSKNVPLPSGGHFTSRGILFGPPSSHQHLGVPSQVYDRSFIKQIKYFESDNLAERYESCRGKFEANGIPMKERLIFHGTSADVESILDNGFLLKACKRFAHGYGIYFSEFPEISKIYGKKLLLCRVLIGRPYQGKEHNIPKGYNSKLVSPEEDGKAQMIIIDKEEQILPAFEIIVNWNN